MSHAYNVDKTRVTCRGVACYARFSVSRRFFHSPTAARRGKWKIAGSHREADSKYPNSRLVEDLLWRAACGGDPEIVRITLDRIDWPRDAPRWYRIVTQPIYFWNHMELRWAHSDLDRESYLECFKLVVDRCDINIRGKFNYSVLHAIAASGDYVRAEERVAFASVALDAGAILDCRDDLLKSTPLGWACRWGRPELVELLLNRGASASEGDAELWATPKAWAKKMGHPAVLTLLES